MWPRAITAPQQAGAIDLVLVAPGRGDDVRGSGAGRHARDDKARTLHVSQFSGYMRTPKRASINAAFLSKYADLNAPRDYEAPGNFGLEGWLMIEWE